MQRPMACAGAPRRQPGGANRSVVGVKAAFLEREHVSDAAAVDAEGGHQASQIEGRPQT